MTYQSCVGPISADELDQIKCYSYINPDVSEQDLKQWDDWFQQFRAEPGVYSISQRDGSKMFYAKLPTGGEQFVDWRVYRTWGNTFHLRYKPFFNKLGLPGRNPFVHPTQKYEMAQLMDQGLRPLTLREALDIAATQAA